MISKVKIIGLQRSGTNYLEELIRRNFEVYVYDHPLYPFYKHAGPHDGAVILNTRDKLYIDPPVRCIPLYNILYILVEKRLDNWIQSINRYPADLRIKHPELFKSGKLDENKARQFHANYYTSWKKLEYPNLLHIQYEDLVRDFTVFLQFLMSKAFLDKKQQHRTFVNVDKVPQSRRFTDEQRKQYLK